VVSQPNDLIKKLQEGNQMGFTALMDLYQNMVYNTALGIVQNEEDADDITQEVFEQVYISIGSFKGQSKLSTWLYKITITKSLDHIKKKKRKKRFGIVKSLFGDLEVEKYSPVEFNHPGVQLEQKERASELFAALKQLPDKQKIAFILHKVEGQSYQEIAEIMNKSLNAVEALMSRAKANLKILLHNYYYKNLSDQ
jgi:RNA polymerase sigma-70 factor (ECF subfamily)